MLKKITYLIEITETKGTLGGRPRIDGTRLSLELLAKRGIKRFLREYPYVKFYCSKGNC